MTDVSKSFKEDAIIVLESQDPKYEVADVEMGNDYQTYVKALTGPLLRPAQPM